jgi:hypothetical protein
MRWGDETRFRAAILADLKLSRSVMAGVDRSANQPRRVRRQLTNIERELPESVRGMIERKIGQLSEEDHTLLTAASVQGYEFESAVVGQALTLDADEVEERLERLERVFAFVKLASEAEFPNRTLTLKSSAGGIVRLEDQVHRGHQKNREYSHHSSSSVD